MGLIRKTAYFATGGIAAPHSKKQRTALKQLAAVQGASPEQVRETGSRRDTETVLTGTPRVTSPGLRASPAQFRTLVLLWKADTEKDGRETVGAWSQRNGYGELGELMPASKLLG